VAAPAERFTDRLADCPFGPVVVDCTLPPPRTADLVAVRPFDPVTVELLLICADADNVQSARKETVMVCDTKFILSLLVRLIIAPTGVLRTKD
jgi:hypothetical protein